MHLTTVININRIEFVCLLHQRQFPSLDVFQGGGGDEWSGDHEDGGWRTGVRRGPTAASNQGPEEKGELQVPSQMGQF